MLTWVGVAFFDALCGLGGVGAVRRGRRGLRDLAALAVEGRVELLVEDLLRGLLDGVAVEDGLDGST